jgi:hypothetical protein
VKTPKKDLGFDMRLGRHGSWGNRYNAALPDLIPRANSCAKQKASPAMRWAAALTETRRSNKAVRWGAAVSLATLGSAKKPAQPNSKSVQLGNFTLDFRPTSRWEI